MNASFTWRFCYEAEPAISTTTVDVGTDVISFECEDMGGIKTAGTAQVAVKNALVAGCGLPNSSPADWVAGVHCDVLVAEDEPVFVTLTGFDAVADHTDDNKRYRIDSLPSRGALYLLNGTAVAKDMVLEAVVEDLATEGFRTVNVTGVEGVANVSVPAGNLTLVYKPEKDFFNALCCLNTDPNPITLPSRHATCPVTCTAGLRYKNALGVSFNNCGSATGCPVTFDFSLGYQEATELHFGESFVNGVRLTVLGVDDMATTQNVTLPTSISLPEVVIDYLISTDGNMRFADADGDTYRVGFLIAVTNSPTTTLSLTLDIATEEGGKPRISVDTSTDTCMNNGGTNDEDPVACTLRGKAYMSDLNDIFKYTKIRTNEINGNASLKIVIFDPVDSPNDFLATSTFASDGPNVTAFVPLRFGNGSKSSNSSVSLTVALWAGIAAGLFFVLMSCCACWGCIIRRAKRGEEAAVWAVKNVLCTDIESRKHPDLSKIGAGGRRSLEAAINADHARLARVVCCALFMKRVCPCFVRFDTQDLKVPNREDMLQEAVLQTRKSIALMHVPKDDGIVAKAVYSDDVEALADIDDSIFDWERHLDEKTNRVFYYNVKTQESRWTPPTVRVKEQQKITDRVSVKMEGPFQPKPPDAPKNNGSSHAEDADAERVKKA